MGCVIVILPAGADDGMLIEVGVPVATVDESPGVTEGGSGANASSMQRSAQSARTTGRMRVMALAV